MMMKNTSLLALVTVLSGCTLAKDVFKAGVWVGILAILAVLFIVGAAMTLMKRA
jgi:hypothetical protein